MMSKDKNTLHPAFYKMMDYFLNPISSVGHLSDKNLLGFNMPNPQDMIRESNEMSSLHGEDWGNLLKKKLINPKEVPNITSFSYYCDEHCSSEYDQWQNSLKMQFETKTLHKYLPKKTSLLDFFPDVQLRMPHENTLLIQEYDKNRVVLVSVVEQSAKKFRKGLKPTGTVSRFHKDHPYRIFNSWNLGRKDTVYTFKLNVYTNLSNEDILNRHEHDPLDIHAITKPICFSLPIAYSLPAGYSIKKTASHIVPLPTSLMPAKDGGPLSATGFSYFAPMFYPQQTYLRNKKMTIDKKEYFDGSGTENVLINDRRSAYQQSHYMLALSALNHMSIYGHPDFKAFCVRQLKKEGLEPKQLSYHEGKPISKLSQKPKYEHYLLDLTIPTESDDHTDGKAGKKRFHLVRGHMMRTPDGGFTWRKSHWRGNRKLGVITKDYNIKIDKRIKKEAQAS
tara:strand:- start:44 stop:1390 length:1347 start_codon:yes stop_codon:yes gene_type:complete